MIPWILILKLIIHLEDASQLWNPSEKVESLRFDSKQGRKKDVIRVSNKKSYVTDIQKRFNAIQLIYLSQSEAVARMCSVKKVYLNISQNSQEKPCARVSFNKLDRNTLHLKPLRSYFLLYVSGMTFWNSLISVFFHQSSPSQK